MRIFKSLLWLLVPTVAMAATVYNFFPPPGSAYSNAAASNFDVGTTATTSAEFSVGNNPAGLTGAATVTIGSPVGTAGGGAILNLSDGGTSAGNFLNSDDTFTFLSTSPGNSVNFNVTTGGGLINSLLIDPNNDSRYIIGNLTGGSSDGSFTVRNKSSVAQGSSSLGIETNITGTPLLGMLTCTTQTGTLSANGTGPGIPGSITGAPAVTGCSLRTTGQGFIFANGNVYIGGWRSSTTGFDLAAPASGVALNIQGGGIALLGGLTADIETLSSTEPRLKLNQTGAGTNLKLWDFDVASTVLTGRTRTDADATGSNWLSVTRGATTAVSNISLGNATDNPTYNFLGTGNVSALSGSFVTNFAFSGGRLQLSGSMTPVGDGIYRTGANTLCGSTGGVQAFCFNSAQAETLSGHLAFTGTSPVVSACGTGPAIDGHATDSAGTVTVGTVAAASCTVTFAAAFSTWNHCRVTSQSTIASFAYSYTLAAITVTGTSLVGDKFDYDCDGS